MNFLFKGICYVWIQRFKNNNDKKESEDDVKMQDGAIPVGIMDNINITKIQGTLRNFWNWSTRKCACSSNDWECNKLLLQ